MTLTGGGNVDLGAGVSIQGGSLLLSDSTVTANAAANGGGLRLASGTATISGSVITDNMASVNGGGIYSSGVGPGSGDSVGPNVDSSGFLTSPILGCATVPVELLTFGIE